MVELLVAHGASLNTKSVLDETPLGKISYASVLLHSKIIIAQKSHDSFPLIVIPVAPRLCSYLKSNNHPARISYKLPVLK